MNIIVSKENIINSLNKVGKAITSKPSLPILNSVFMEAKNNKLVLRGTDTDISVETEIPVEVLNEGKLLVDYKIFNEIIRKLPNEKITLTSAGSEVDIICKKSKFSVVLRDASEYPEFPKVDDKSTISIKLKQADLRELINKVYFSASTDDARPILKGVFIEVQNSRFTLTTMDGYRLSTASIKIDKDMLATAVADSKHMIEISKLLDNSGEVEIGFTENKILCQIGNTTTICRLLEGKYMNYQSLINQFGNNDKQFNVNRNELLLAIERANLLSKNDKGKNLVKFVIKDTLTIVSRSNVGNSTEELEINNSAGFTETFEIAFNSLFINDILRNLINEDLTFYMSSNDKPCIIRGKGVSEEEETFLVLPVRINLIN